MMRPPSPRCGSAAVTAAATPLDIYVEEPLAGGHVVCGGRRAIPAADAGVIHENIETPEMLDDMLHQGCDLRRVGLVGLKGGGLDALLRNSLTTASALAAEAA